MVCNEHIPGSFSLSCTHTLMAPLIINPDRRRWKFPAFPVEPGCHSSRERGGAWKVILGRRGKDKTWGELQMEKMMLTKTCWELDLYMSLFYLKPSKKCFFFNQDIDQK